MLDDISNLYDKMDESHEDKVLQYLDQGLELAYDESKHRRFHGKYTNKPNFKQWFGDSKVRDVLTLEPLVVYHGTVAPEPFTEFGVRGPQEHDENQDDEYVRSGSGVDPSTFLGAHFSADAKVASDFASGLYGEREGQTEHGRVYPVYLKIEKPWVVKEEEIHNWMYQQSYNANDVEFVLSRYEDDYEKYESNIEFREKINRETISNSLLSEEHDTTFAQEMADKLRNHLQSQGYDGIIYENMVEGGVSYIVFESTQIKSALSSKFGSSGDITLAYTESKHRRFHGKWTNKPSRASEIARLKTLIANVVPNYEIAQKKFEELYSGKNYEDIKGNPEFIAARGEYNKLSDILVSLRDELRKNTDAQQITEYVKVSHLPEVQVANGIDVDQDVAEALVGGMLQKPWGDESRWAAGRYVYRLTKADKQNHRYRFDIVAKHAIEPVPEPNIGDGIPNREGFAYRGMSREEWENSVQTGQLQSMGSHNLGQEGLTFYGKAETALHYSAGFAPYVYTVAPKRSGVVVEIPRNLVMDHTDRPQDIPQSEFAHLGAVPISSVTNVFDVVATKFRPGFMEAVWEDGQIREGSGMHPGSQFVVVPRAEDKKLELAFTEYKHKRFHGKFADKPKLEEYTTDLIKDLRSRISKKGVAGSPNAWIALGHRLWNLGSEEQQDNVMGMVEAMEKASNRESMLKAIGSQGHWASGYSVAYDEWRAARGMGANETAAKRTRDGLAANKSEFSEDDLNAFKARTKVVQDFVREEYGDEIKVYRGVGNAQYNKLALQDVPLGSERDLAVYGLSSWSLKEYDASEFAGPKGVVVSTTIPVEDVFLIPRQFGVPDVIRFIEDREEIVTLNKNKTRKVKIIGSGHKAQKRWN